MKLKNLLQGRLGRARYFSYILITLSVFTLLMVAYRNIFGVPGDEIFAFHVAFFFAVVVLTIRRLHDLNLRGWWALIFPASFATNLGLFIGFAFDPSPGYLVGLTIWSMYGLNASALLFLFFWKGTSGSNRFGEAPLR